MERRSLDDWIEYYKKQLRAPTMKPGTHLAREAYERGETRFPPSAYEKGGGYRPEMYGEYTRAFMEALGVFGEYNVPHGHFYALRDVPRTIEARAEKLGITPDAFAQIQKGIEELNVIEVEGAKKWGGKGIEKYKATLTPTQQARLDYLIFGAGAQVPSHTTPGGETVYMSQQASSMLGALSRQAGQYPSGGAGGAPGGAEMATKVAGLTTEAKQWGDWVKSEAERRYGKMTWADLAALAEPGTQGETLVKLAFQLSQPEGHRTEKRWRTREASLDFLPAIIQSLDYPKFQRSFLSPTQRGEHLREFAPPSKWVGF